MIILLAIFCFYFWRSKNDSQGNLIKEEITFDKNEKQTVNKRKKIRNCMIQ